MIYVANVLLLMKDSIVNTVAAAEKRALSSDMYIEEPFLNRVLKQNGRALLLTFLLFCSLIISIGTSGYVCQPIAVDFA